MHRAAYAHPSQHQCDETHQVQETVQVAKGAPHSRPPGGNGFDGNPLAFQIRFETVHQVVYSGGIEREKHAVVHLAAALDQSGLREVGHGNKDPGSDQAENTGLARNALQSTGDGKGG